MTHAVVGAGLGGLTAGALLAESGADVHVLEAHDRPGGCATTFQRFDADVEVSLHEMDGLDDHDLKRPVLEALGVLEAVDLEQPDDFYRYVDPEAGRDFVAPHGREAFADALAAEFPADADGVREFVALVCRLRREMADWPFLGDPSLTDYALAPVRQRTLGRYRDATLGGVLDDCVDGEGCKLALAANLGYYHDDPHELAFPYFASAQGGYLEGGSHYVRGGSQRLSNALVDRIETAGGTVECERLVTGVDVANGRADAVRHVHPRTKDDARRTDASAVVANAAVPNVADHLLPDPYGDELAAAVADRDLAPSLSTLYLLFEPTPAELGNDHYATKVAGRGVDTLADLPTAMRGSYGRRPFGFTDFSQLDAGLAPDGRSVGILTAVDYAGEWSGLTDAEYREKKARVVDVLLRRLDDAIPGVRDAVVHRELATPKTIRRYTHNPAGTPYGFAQTPDQSLGRRDVDSPLPNLAFASAWASPGGGFTGAMLGGARAACEFSPDVQAVLSP